MLTIDLGIICKWGKVHSDIQLRGNREHTFLQSKVRGQQTWESRRWVWSQLPEWRSPLTSISPSWCPHSLFSWSSTKEDAVGLSLMEKNMSFGIQQLYPVCQPHLPACLATRVAHTIQHGTRHILPSFSSPHGLASSLPPCPLCQHALTPAQLFPWLF